LEGASNLSRASTEIIGHKQEGSIWWLTCQSNGGGRTSVCSVEECFREKASESKAKVVEYALRLGKGCPKRLSHRIAELSGESFEDLFPGLPRLTKKKSRQVFSEMHDDEVTPKCKQRGHDVYDTRFYAEVENLHYFKEGQRMHGDGCRECKRTFGKGIDDVKPTAANPAFVCCTYNNEAVDCRACVCGPCFKRKQGDPMAGDIACRRKRTKRTRNEYDD